MSVRPAVNTQQNALMQHLLASVFMSVGAAVAIIGLDGKVIAANPAFLRLLKYSARDIDGRKVWDLIPGDAGRDAAAKAALWGGRGDPHEFAASVVLGDGTLMPVRLTLTSVDQPQLKRFWLVTIHEALGAGVDASGATTQTKQHEIIVAGKIQLIGLDHVKAALGSRWETHAERAMMVAETILRHRLGPEDVVSRTLDNGFVICFAEGTEEEAAFRAAMIAREIRNRLIGDSDDPSGSTVTALTQGIPFEPGLMENGRPNLSALEQRLDAGRAEAERRARAELSVAMASATLEPERLFDSVGKAVPIVFTALPRELQDQIEVALATLPSIETVDADLDILKLTLAAEAAMADIREARTRVFLLPVDFEVFGSRKRQDRYLATCRKLLDPVRQRIMFMLSGVPKNASQTRLFEVIRLLKPFGKGVGMDLAAADFIPTDLAQHRIPLVALTAEEILATARSSAATLDKLVRKLQLNNARLIARSVHGETERRAVTALGASLVSFAADEAMAERDGAPKGAPDPSTFAAAVKNIPVSVVFADATKPDHPVIHVNPGFTLMTGYTADEVIGRNMRLLQGPGTDRGVVAEMREAIGHRRPIKREIQNYRKDGTPIWSDVIISPVQNEAGKVTTFIGIQTDISEQRRRDAAQRELSKLFEGLAENIPGFIFQRVMTGDGRLQLTYLSPSFKRLVHAGPDDPGQPAEWIHPEDAETVHEALRKSAEELSPFSAEYRVIGKDGQLVWIRSKARPARAPNGNVVWNGVAVDITPEKTAERSLTYLAGHDALTGLLNRQAFRARLRDCIFEAQASGGTLGVMWIDLSAFQAVNDAYGAAAGDRILSVVGERIARFDWGKAVGRDGGDEFTLIIDGADRVRALAQGRDVCRAISKAIPLNEHSLVMQAYVGIAFYPDHAKSGDGAIEPIAESLMKAADIALYTAKRAGPGTCHIYSAEDDDRIRNSAVLLQSLHAALELKQFALHFQPIVELDSGRILGAEALIRWFHPELGLQRPDQFIPLAEESGLIVPMGAWVVDEALRCMRQWEADGLGRPRIAVNIAAAQVKHPDALRDLRDRVLDSGIDPMMLEVELTESSLIDPTPAMLAGLEGLRELGVSVAMDDFGTGYSSFRYLRSLPIDKLKIDQSFVRHMAPESSDHAIVRGILSIGQDLGLNVVVEGVETEEQRDLLLREGCRIGQGYFYSMPVSAEDFSWMLSEQTSLPIGRSDDGSKTHLPAPSMPREMPSGFAETVIDLDPFFEGLADD